MTKTNLEKAEDCLKEASDPGLEFSEKQTRLFRESIAQALIALTKEQIKTNKYLVHIMNGTSGF